MKYRFNLKDSDQIGVIATGSPVEPLRLERGVEELKRCNYFPSMPLDCSGRDRDIADGFGSASPEKRAHALSELYRNGAVRVIISARGGYSTSELLPLLNFKELAQYPKPFVGFSDVTPLLLQLAFRSGIPAIHGPALAVEFAEADGNAVARESVDTLLQVLRGKISLKSYACYMMTSVKNNCVGDRPVQGQIIAGNLAMLVTLLGTPWDVCYGGKVLFIEDIGEAPYRIHRMLLQMYNAGKLSRLAGLVFGQFVNCGRDDSELRQSIDWFLGRYLRDSNYPIYWGFPFGHGLNNMPLPILGRCELGQDRVLIYYQ